MGFQLTVFLGFGAVAIYRYCTGTAVNPTPLKLEWFNPFAVDSLGTFVAGVSLSLFIYWGWDVSLDGQRGGGRCQLHPPGALPCSLS